MTIKVYSKTHCPHCVSAKARLNELGIEFEELNIESDTEARQHLVESGFRTVPQIFNDDELFVEGGWSGLQALSKDEILERLNTTN